MLTWRFSSLAAVSCSAVALVSLMHRLPFSSWEPWKACAALKMKPAAQEHTSGLHTKTATKRDDPSACMQQQASLVMADQPECHCSNCSVQFQPNPRS